MPHLTNGLAFLRAMLGEESSPAHPTATSSGAVPRRSAWSATYRAVAYDN
ncbi:hypothetical protein ACXJJ3_29195 [Kribbella sp. WER1]